MKHLLEAARPDLGEKARRRGDHQWLASGLGFDVVLCRELEDSGRGMIFKIAMCL